MPDHITLDFSHGPTGAPVLERVVLQTSQGQQAVSEQHGVRPFQWDRQGPRVLALALVRLARWRGRQEWPETIPLLSGKARPNEAASLGDALMTRGKIYWLAHWLSPSEPPDAEDAVARLRRWFVFKNIQGKKANTETTVGAAVTEFPPSAVEIRLDGVELQGGGLDRLERQLSASLHQSLPPLPCGPGSVIAGFLPSTGALPAEREPMLASIDEHYLNAETKVLVVLGAGGAGKTTLAREWLGQRCMAGSVKQEIVFGWSFYRQGYGAGAGQLLADFYDHLGTALGVVITDAMLPVEVADTLVEAMKKRPTLLFLDGIEVVLGPTSALRGGFREMSLAELLPQIGCSEGALQSWVLMTSRIPLREDLAWSFPDVQHLRIRGCLPETARPSQSGQTTPLEWNLALSQCSSSLAAEGVISEVQQSPNSDKIPGLVRRLLGQLSGTPSWALLLGMSFFDRPPLWEHVLHLVCATPPIPSLTEKWADLTSEQWQQALHQLESVNLLHVNATGNVVLHPRIVECLASEMQRSLSLAWVSGHRCLYSYFAQEPELHLPNTVVEMEPLFRAVWHGCQAGDYKKSYEEVLFPRICRGNAGYPIFELGAYEAGFNLAALFTPDFDTFPPGCDLAPDHEFLTIHCASLCSRYQDRLEEAYEIEKRIWNRRQSCSSGSIIPVALHLLRCQQIFGDLKESGPVLRVLARQLVRQPMSPSILQVSSGFMATAIGFLGATAAITLRLKGHKRSARLVMNLSRSRAIKLQHEKKMLAPGIAGSWQALALLDLGDYEFVAKALEHEELRDAVKRNKETGMIQLVQGRCASARANSANGKEKESLNHKAQEYLIEGLDLVKRNRLRWWQATFLMALATHYAKASMETRALEMCEAALELAQTHEFKILAIDAEILSSKLKKQRIGKDLLKAMNEIGYQGGLKI